SPLVIISHRLWQQQFGGDPAVGGQTLLLNGINRTIVGITAEGFAYPARDRLDAWASHSLWVVGRVRAGFSVEQARAEANLAARRIVDTHPETFNPSSPLEPAIARINDRLLGQGRPDLCAM